MASYVDGMGLAGCKGADCLADSCRVGEPIMWPACLRFGWRRGPRRETAVKLRNANFFARTAALRLKRVVWRPVRVVVSTYSSAIIHVMYSVQSQL